MRYKIIVINDYDWNEIDFTLQKQGYAILPSLLSETVCNEFRELYDLDELFRKKISMHRHGYGKGEYKYFDYPLPERIQTLRNDLFGKITIIANEWSEISGESIKFPETLSKYIMRCHQAGQTRPTPLLLKYKAGDYNCLHQDIYGYLMFPFQFAILLSVPGFDFTGGEFVITNSLSGSPSIVEVIPLNQGDAVIFAVHSRPVGGKGGRIRKAKIRHGVSKIDSGERKTLGLIFHDSN